MDTDILVGRQPIYNSKLDVVAYELLFRGHKNAEAAVFSDGDKATSKLILNTFFDNRLNTIVGDLPAFINLTRNFLLDPDSIPFNKNNVVLEILEDIKIDDELVSAIRILHSEGFILALDDFVFDQSHKEILDYIEIIKIDVLNLNQQQIEQQVKQLIGFKGKLLAEKIETFDEFEFCKSIGFDYYQGFFLSKPKNVHGQKIPTHKLSIIQILSKIYHQDTKTDDIKKQIQMDVSLSYRLLRYLNSNNFGFETKIQSIDDAVNTLGIENLRKWVTLVSICGMSDKPSDLITTSLVRAKMCELLAEHKREDNKEHFFIIGLFSNLPVLMDLSMQHILESIPLADELKLALLDNSGTMGKTLQFCINYEQTNWDNLISIGTEFDAIKNCYFKAILWANQLTKEMII